MAQALVAGVLLIAAAPPQLDRVDPQRVQDDDFQRHRDPGEWDGLTVDRIVFREGGTVWRVWRIANQVRPDGPLWVIPHDNEDAAFSAGLDGVRAWGGVMMAVDTDAAGGGAVSRFNRATGGAPVDPNRNFRDYLPLYAGTMLADLGVRPRPIIALHTNAPGFDPSQSNCPPSRGGGSGNISIELCNDRYFPNPSQSRAWPFDDDDSLILLPQLAARDPHQAFCARALTNADANVVFERVAQSDGSLSNYAVQHGLNYLNIETEDRGHGAAGIAEARGRLVRMIDLAMERCGEIRGLGLRTAR